MAARHAGLVCSSRAQSSTRSVDGGFRSRPVAQVSKTRDRGVSLSSSSPAGCCERPGVVIVTRVLAAGGRGTAILARAGVSVEVEVEADVESDTC